MHLRLITCVSLISLLAIGAIASERNIISEPPSFAAVTVVRAEIADLAVDAAGNKFLCGSAWGTNDFNPGAGEDFRGGEYAGYLFLTRYNADGSYAWTATYEVADGTSYATALTVVEGTVYVTGSMYSWNDKIDPAKVMGGPYSSAIVVAFDAASGEIKNSFGTNGVAMYTGLGEVQAYGISAANGTIYVTGVTSEPYYYEWDGNVPPGEPGDKDPTAGGNGGGDGTAGDPNKRCMPYYETKAFPFVWAVDAASGASAAGFGDSGSVVIDSVENAAGIAVAVSGGTVFVTGNSNGYYYAYPVLMKPGMNDRGYYTGMGQTFVAALNASNGTLVSTFGAEGVVSLSALGASTAHALAADGSTIFVAGAYQDPVVIAGDEVNIAIWPYENYSDAYVAAFDAATGALKTGFGTEGMVRFGREFADEAWDVAVDAGVVYVTGAYGNRYDVSLYNYAYDENGGVKDPNGGGEEFWHYTFSHPDAFVLALDSATGARNANFSADGLETFGGTDYDFGRSIAVSGGHVIAAGSFYSHNAALGGAVGGIDCGTLNGFILELDTATGGGGAVESNHPIFADAGPDQTIRIPEKGYYLWEGDGKGDPANERFVPSAYVCFYARVVDDVLSYELTNPTVTWAVVSAPEDVELYNPHDPYVMVTLTTPGDYVFSFTAAAGGTTSTDTVTVRVIQNHAPVVDSGITATPANPKPGEAVVFSVSTHDPDGDEVFYSWMFGDSYECLYEASVKHIFEEPGTYDVSLFIYDGIDSLEIHYSITVEGAGPALTVDNMQFNFAASSSKSNGIKVSGKLTTPKNIEMYGKHVELSVGGGTVGFDLDEKGKDQNREGTFALKVRGKKASFTAKLTGSDWKDALGMEDRGSGRMTVPVSLKLGARTFNGSKDVNVSQKGSVTRGK